VWQASNGERRNHKAGGPPYQQSLQKLMLLGDPKSVSCQFPARKMYSGKNNSFLQKALFQQFDGKEFFKGTSKIANWT
jgi:hypothetical protein